MPEIYPVTTQGFSALLTELGITLRPSAPLWWLSDTISPVAIVNSQVTLNAVLTPAAQIVSTEGVQVAPVDATLLADTGQLAAGIHTFVIWVSAQGGNLPDAVTIAHRNAANDGSLFEHDAQWGQASGAWVNVEFTMTLQIATNERVRAIQSDNAPASAPVQVTIFHRQVS